MSYCIVSYLFYQNTKCKSEASIQKSNPLFHLLVKLENLQRLVASSYRL